MLVEKEVSYKGITNYCNFSSEFYHYLYMVAKKLESLHIRNHLSPLNLFSGSVSDNMVGG